MFRRWLLAPVLREIAELRHATNRGFATMSKEMDDLVSAESELASEIDLVLTEFETLAAQLASSPSPSAVEDIAQKIGMQTARLKGALSSAQPAAPPSTPAPAPAPAPPSSESLPLPGLAPVVESVPASEGPKPSTEPAV